jgi:hypothetical protein
LIEKWFFDIDIDDALQIDFAARKKKNIPAIPERRQERK